MNCSIVSFRFPQANHIDDIEGAWNLHQYEGGNSVTVRSEMAVNRYTSRFLPAGRLVSSFQCKDYPWILKCVCVMEQMVWLCWCLILISRRGYRRSERIGSSRRFNTTTKKRLKFRFAKYVSTTAIILLVRLFHFCRIKTDVR